MSTGYEPKCPKCGGDIVYTDTSVGWEDNYRFSMMISYCCCNPSCQHKGKIYAPYISIDDAMEEVVFDMGE